MVQLPPHLYNSKVNISNIPVSAWIIAWWIGITGTTEITASPCVRLHSDNGQLLFPAVHPAEEQGINLIHCFQLGPF